MPATPSMSLMMCTFMPLPLSRCLFCSGHDLRDDRRLRVRVLLHVLPVAGRQLPLRGRVALSVGVVPAQPVAEQQHPVGLLTAGREDVEIDVRVRPLEQPVLEPLRLADVKHVAGRLEVGHVRRPRRRSPGTSSTMSMIGLAGRVGTDVEPACSSRTTVSPSAARMRTSSRSYSAGQPGRSRRSRSAPCSSAGAPTTTSGQRSRRTRRHRSDHVRSRHSTTTSPTTSPRELSTGTGYRARRRGTARAPGGAGAELPSSDLKAKPVPSGAMRAEQPLGAALRHPTRAARRMRIGVERALAAHELGCARIAARMRSAPSSSASRGERRGHPLERQRERHDAAAVDGRRDLVGRQSGGRRDLLEQLLLQRVVGEPVAAVSQPRARQTARKPACFPEQLWWIGARRPALLLAALEVVLRRRSLREQAAHGGDLRRLGAVRRAGDRDLRGRRDRAARGRAAAPGSASRSTGREQTSSRIAGGSDDLAVADRDARGRGGAPRPCPHGARIR